MSRRDTIIIAVLVNAGLLMVLFATALKSDDKKKDKQVSYKQLAETPKQKPPEEVVVQQYAMSSVPTVMTEEIPLEKFQIPEEKPVEPKPLAPPPAAPSKDVYCVDVTVKKGDFLEKIAKANNTTVSAIMAENKLSSTQLKVGQVLRVPVKQKPVESSAVAAVSKAAEEFYVVKDGDNPWLIASKNHISVSELLKLNNLDDQKARRLRPGDRLKIR